MITDILSHSGHWKFGTGPFGVSVITYSLIAPLLLTVATSFSMGVLLAAKAYILK